VRSGAAPSRNGAGSGASGDGAGIGAAAVMFMVSRSRGTIAPWKVNTESDPRSGLWFAFFFRTRGGSARAALPWNRFRIAGQECIRLGHQSMLALPCRVER
jgi:hypothetical protein